MAETVSFKSGEETITGILVKPNSGQNLPVVVFQQGSGNHAFDGYETQAWGPHKFYIEDVLLDLKSRMTIVLVTNLVQQAHRLADRTAFLNDSRLIEVDDTETIFTKASHELTCQYVAGDFG